MNDAFATPTNITEEGPTVPATPGAEAPGTVTLGRYVLGAKHAEGGLGEVFLAVDTELNRDVALKRIKAQNPNVDHCRRFLVEGEVTGRLEHPGVVPVYGLGHDAAGRPFYVMRFVRGETLHEAIQRFHAADGPLREPGERSKALRELLGQFVATCNTIAYAHSRGILHRDLKPANIMLGPYGETLVVDWGLAKPFARSEEARSVGEETLAPGSDDDSQQTRQGQAVGTPQYMSPEQAAGRWSVVGPASDVYSLGATLYHLLAGKVPFDGRDVGEVMDKVKRGAFPPPSQRKPDVPRALEAVCLKAMALAPEDRYPSALDLAAEVKNWLADEPVGAWREPWRVRAGRWVKRHPAQVSAGVAGLLLAAVVTAAIGFVLAAFEREREARTRADLLAHHSAQEVLRALDDTDERRSALHRELGDPLQVHRLLSDIDRWDRTVHDARKALKRAQGHAESSKDGLTPEIVARLEKLDNDLSDDERDLRLGRELDQIRLEAGVSTEGNWNTALAGPKYRDAFRGANYNLTQERPETVAAQIAASHLRFVLVAALDHWAEVTTDQLQAQILMTARLADSEPWRDQVREPKMLGAEMLQELAAVAQPAQQSPQVLILLANRLTTAKRTEKAAALLRAAVVDHTKDFWLFFRLGNLVADAESVGYYHAALVVRPDSSVAHYNLGRALYVRKDLEGAMQHYRKAIELDPKLVLPHVGLGYVLRDKKELDQAIKEYQKAIELDPKNALPHNGLGNALLDKKELDQAIKEYQKAIELDPKNALPHNGLGNALRDKKELDQAIKEYQKAIKLDPKYASPHNGLGNVLRDKKELDQAIKEYQKAIELDAKDALPCNNLGNVLRDKKELDQAIKEYQKAIELDPKDALPHNGLGNVLYEKKELDQAIKQYQKAIELDPKFALPHNGLGVALYDKKELDQAIKQYQKAIELDPKFASPHNGLGNALLDKKELDRAIKEYQQAIELDPKFALPHHNLGNALRNKKELDQAIKEYRKAIELDPKAASFRVGLGNVLCDKKELDQAIKEYQKAIELDPKDALPHSGLGNVLYEKKELDQAIKEYQKSIDLDPNYALPHNNLGIALLKQAKFAEAGKATAKYLNLLPGNDPRRKAAQDRLKRCDELLALDRKLAAFLASGEMPKGTDEQLALADLCWRFKRYHATAVRLCAGAFAADATLADDLSKGFRYNAACSACLAAAGMGLDPVKLAPANAVKLRASALSWLRADLQLLAKKARSEEAEAVLFVVAKLSHWQTDTDIATVRDRQALALLPPEERQDWQKLWADVQDALQKAQGRFRETVNEKGILTAKEKAKIQEVKMTAGTSYIIDLESTAFDTLLKLEDAQGKLLADNNDVRPGNTNSRIVFTPTVSGRYRITASAFEHGIGPYVLRVRELIRP